MIPNHDFPNGVQNLSLDGNGISNRDGHRTQSEKLVRNGASDESNEHSVDEKHFRNGSTIFTPKENARTEPRTDEYDVDFS
jgi:hypothetical protein